jgi:hypothetical protein
MPDTRQFPCTQPQFYSLATMLSSHGLTIDTGDDYGKVQQGSWDVSWAYDGATLTLTVNSHPFGEEDAMWRKVQAALS